MPDSEVTTAAEGARYLRAQDLCEGEITADDPIFVTQRYLATIARSHIKPGYLLFSIMASIGNCAIVPSNFQTATANRAVGILVPKSDDAILTKFMFYLLSTDLGTELYTRIKKGGLQQRTNLADVSLLEFPLPPKEIRSDLASAMDSARAKRRAKLAEADALLAGLDGYVLETLGLTLPPKDARMVFAIRRGTVPTRFDPHFHLPAFAQVLRMLSTNGSEPLGGLIVFSKETWKSEQHESDTFRYIEIGSVNRETGEATAVETPVAEAPSRARMVVADGDIIVSLTRPHHGSIAQITPDLDGCVASTGFAVLRGVDEQRVMRDYLWCILRTRMSLAQMLQRASGGNYPAITEPELAKVLIPVPKMDAQETIAIEARRRREEARRLRAEAEAGWQAAKRWFEEQLLGLAQS